MIKELQAYLIDRETGQIVSKEDTKDLDAYVQNLHDIIEKSKNTSFYAASNPPIGVIERAVESVHRCDNGMNEEDTRVVNRNFQKIALEFLAQETYAQEKVEHLSTIKIGCLVQAILIKEDGYRYFISKVNSIDFLNNSDLMRNRGIEISKKPIGKSCMIDLHRGSDGRFSVGEIRVLLDNNAAYFHKEFLKVEPIYQDDYNTRTMTATVTKYLDGDLKRSYPKHRLYLKNAFVHYVHSHDFIDYGEICSDVFFKYIDNQACDIEVSEKEDLKCKLQELPAEKKFSTQFSKVAKEVKAKNIQSAYDLNHGVQLVLSEFNQSGLSKTIISGAEPGGETYIKIFTNNQEALEAFAP